MEGWIRKALWNEAPFRFGKNLASSGIRTATPWSEVGSANRSATRTLLDPRCEGLDIYLGWNPFPNSFPQASGFWRSCCRVCCRQSKYITVSSAKSLILVMAAVKTWYKVDTVKAVLTFCAHYQLFVDNISGQNSKMFFEAKRMLLNDRFDNNNCVLNCLAGKGMVHGNYICRNQTGKSGSKIRAVRCRVPGHFARNNLEPGHLARDGMSHVFVRAISYHFSGHLVPSFIWMIAVLCRVLSRLSAHGVLVREEKVK